MVDELFILFNPYLKEKSCPSDELIRQLISLLRSQLPLHREAFCWDDVGIVPYSTVNSLRRCSSSMQALLIHSHIRLPT